MGRQFRLAAIDLDGTLLGPEHRVSPRNAAAVTALAARGIVCVLASGRMHQSTARYAFELGLDAPIISYNGAMVRYPDSGETWLHQRAPAGPSSEVVSYCIAHKLHLNYYLDDRLLVADRGPWADFYTRQTGSEMHAIGDLNAVIGAEPTKMILIDSPAVTDELEERFRSQLGASLYITKTNPEYLEFMHPDANKGSALELVANRLGIPRDETIAFGDGRNDLPMLDWAGFSVAMGSASAGVRAAANLVAPPFDEDGLGLAIESLFRLV